MLVLFLDSVPWAGTKWLETTVKAILILMALTVAALAIYKSIRFAKAKASSEQFAPELVQALRKLDWEGAHRLCESRVGSEQ